MSTWRSATVPTVAPIGPGGWVRVLLRGSVLTVLIIGGLGVQLPMRLVERAFYGARRPWSPYVMQVVFRFALLVLGIGYRRLGQAARRPGAVVCNHVSWLDILALSAGQRVFFVAKAEVAGWPVIGWLARVVGTVFIARRPRQAQAQNATLDDRLRAGHRLVLFPEGTSSDGKQILPFKSTLFEALFTNQIKGGLVVQPVTISYVALASQDRRFYGWWGDMDLAPHLLQVLAARRQGSVQLRYHPPLKVADFADRKALARACEDAVRAGLAEFSPD